MPCIPLSDLPTVFAACSRFRPVWWKLFGDPETVQSLQMVTLLTLLLVPFAGLLRADGFRQSGIADHLLGENWFFNLLFFAPKLTHVKGFRSRPWRISGNGVSGKLQHSFGNSSDAAYVGRCSSFMPICCMEYFDCDQSNSAGKVSLASP